MESKKRAIVFAALAALLYSLSSPLGKILLSSFPPTLLAGTLYMGAGIGDALIYFHSKGKSKEIPLQASDSLYVVLMVVLDIAAPILMMWGLKDTGSENASLLGNFEIVATSLFAFLIFREKVSPVAFLGIGLTFLSTLILSYEGSSSLSFSHGSLLILASASLWGLENNCTRRISGKDPMEIVAVKGIGSGSIGIALGLVAGERFPGPSLLLPALALGFVSYGLSIFLYIRSQRVLGAAKTSAYYALSPFMGAGISILIFKTKPAPLFFLAILVMGAGSAIIGWDSLKNSN